MPQNIDHIKTIVGAAAAIAKEQNAGRAAFEKMHHYIYTAHYIQPYKLNGITQPSKADLEKSISVLRKANNSKESFDEGWLVEKNEQGETLTAIKGNRQVILKPGQYLSVGNNSKNDTKQYVKIYRSCEYSAADEIFYYAYGNAAEDYEEEDTVRFYFNTTFEGNVKWMQLLTESLNKFSVPFLFKCLVHPFFYKRSDTAVLYCGKQYAAFANEIIKGLYSEVSAMMRNRLPLFTGKIKKGIGFAEQPLNIQESFGTHWSKIIAAAILKAVEENQPEEKWLTAVLHHITINHGYKDLNALYRNPGSQYPYPFINNAGL